MYKMVKNRFTNSESLDFLPGLLVYHALYRMVQETQELWVFKVFKVISEVFEH